MSITKKYSANGVCKVTFTLPEELAKTAKKVYVVGEFNNWNSTGLPMKKKNGKYYLTIELPKNKEYEFRYLVNDTNWETDWEADGIKPSPFPEEPNSVVKV
jgi:1,4-alpha-glucan branching enzyme